MERRRGYFDPAVVKRELEATKTGKKYQPIKLPDKMPFYKIKDDNAIRVMPAMTIGHAFWKSAFIHYGVGPNEEQFLCLDMVKAKTCPICEQVRLLEKEGGNAELVKSLKRKERTFMYIIDRDEEAKGIQFLNVPASVGDPITRFSHNKRRNTHIDITCPDTGKDVYFTKKGAGVHTKYGDIKLDEESSMVTDEHLLKVPATIDEVLIFVDADTIVNEMFGENTTPLGVASTNTPQPQAYVQPVPQAYTQSQVHLSTPPPQEVVSVPAPLPSPPLRNRSVAQIAPPIVEDVLAEDQYIRYETPANAPPVSKPQMAFVGHRDTVEQHSVVATPTVGHAVISNDAPKPQESPNDRIKRLMAERTAKLRGA